MQTEVRMTVRLPVAIRDWLEARAVSEFSSMNYEIVRALRARMTAATGETLQGETPAAAQNETACQGGPINTHAGRNSAHVKAPYHR